MIRPTVQHHCARSNRSDRRPQQQHAHKTTESTLPPLGDCNGTHRHARSSATNHKWRCAVAHSRWGERGAATHTGQKKTFTSLQSLRAGHIVSTHGVLTLHHTTAAPRNTPAVASLRTDVSRSAKNSWQASRMTAISTCSTTPQLKITFLVRLKHNWPQHVRQCGQIADAVRDDASHVSRGRAQHRSATTTNNTDRHGRPTGNVRAQGSPATVRATHMLRLPDPVLPEHVTPDQLLSHGSLPVLWFCQPVLLLHVLPLVAMYSSTSAARWSGAVGATTPTRTPHSNAGATSTTRAPRTWATERANSASTVMQLAQSWFARRGE
jgi:hypothetical protein